MHERGYRFLLHRSPEESVRLAERTGYSAVGLRLHLARCGGTPDEVARISSLGAIGVSFMKA